MAHSALAAKIGPFCFRPLARCCRNVQAPQRVEVAEREVRIIGSKSNLLQTLTASGVKATTPGVRSSVLKWRREWS